jgi:sulfoxide reductase heme-binding subunit YedZ
MINLRNLRERHLKILKVFAFLACLVPLFLLGLKALRGDLGADPITLVTHVTGDWTLRFLLITLAVTPLRKLLQLNWLIRFRRMLGLFAFFYGCLHLMTYIGLDQFFNIRDMIDDISKRRFIMAGMLGWTTMLPLALTSTAWSIRKLGGKRWQQLHYLIYVSASAGVVHYWWLVKQGVRTPMNDTLMLIALLAVRPLLDFMKKAPPRGGQKPTYKTQLQMK